MFSDPRRSLTGIGIFLTGRPARKETDAGILRTDVPVRQPTGTEEKRSDGYTDAEKSAAAFVTLPGVGRAYRTGDRGAVRFHYSECCHLSVLRLSIQLHFKQFGEINTI